MNKTKDKRGSENKNVHAKHRERLRKLVFTTDFENLSVYQILEYILTLSLPRIDVNPVAHDLLDEFGTIQNVMNADFENLMTVKNVGEKAAMSIVSLNKFFKYLSTAGKDDKRPVLSTPNQILDHINPFFEGKTKEAFYAICLNAKQQVVKTSLIASGDANSVSIDLKKLNQVVSSTNASYVVLAHNHPNGQAIPSSDDFQTTQKIYSFLSTLGIGLIDHFIIADGNYYSFSASNALDHIREINQEKTLSFSNKLLNLVTTKSCQKFEKEKPKTNPFSFPTNRIDA